MRALIAGRYNHPCVVSWIVFNEGMGLWNPAGYKLDDGIRAFMTRMAGQRQSVRVQSVRVSPKNNK